MDDFFLWLFPLTNPDSGLSVRLGEDWSCSRKSLKTAITTGSGVEVQASGINSLLLWRTDKGMGYNV